MLTSHGPGECVLCMNYLPFPNTVPARKLRLGEPGDLPKSDGSKVRVKGQG